MRPGLLTTEFASAASTAAALLVLAYDPAVPALVRACACLAAAWACNGYGRARGRTNQAVARSKPPG